MTDAEVSRRLALAVGWSEEAHDVILIQEFFETKRPECCVWLDSHWKVFDYRDPAVIWPIAERFDAFPHKRAGADGWTSVTGDAWLAGETFSVADTAAKAVALAVIEAKEQK